MIRTAGKKTVKVGSTLVAALVAFALFAPAARAGSEPEEKLRDAVEVVEKITEIPEKGIPPALLRNAYGVAVVPGVIKVGFVLGGRYGKGVVSVKRNGSWSNPSFVTLTGGSLGWQIGAQSTDIILVFKSSKSVDGIKRGKFTLGADASVAAGPVGRHVEAGTDVEMKAEIYSYSRSRGLFVGLAVEGAALQMDDESNGKFYGQKGITPDEIFDSPSAPPAASKFKKALARGMSYK